LLQGYEKLYGDEEGKITDFIGLTLLTETCVNIEQYGG
jgi:hypothetical protein